jgi:hypothetical protein
MLTYGAGLNRGNLGTVGTGAVARSRAAFAAYCLYAFRSSSSDHISLMALR